MTCEFGYHNPNSVPLVKYVNTLRVLVNENKKESKYYSMSGTLRSNRRQEAVLVAMQR